MQKNLGATTVTKMGHGGPVGSIVRGVLGFAAGTLLGIVGIVTGLLLILLPPIGWVVAPIVILASLVLPAILALCGSQIVVGDCPHCGSHVSGLPSEGKITCGTCDHAIVVTRR